MEISEIKAQLSMADVLTYYGLKPDKSLKLHCPFHEDKTPSLQVYYKTQTCYCFSANCPTNGKSLDVIDFIMFKEDYSKHEAILKAKSLINGQANANRNQPLTRQSVLNQLFTYFSNALHNSKPAKAYLTSRHLDKLIGAGSLPVGYNSGQFHHGTRKDAQLIEKCVQYGLLLDKGHVNNKTGEKAYSAFGKGCIVFPLKDSHGQTVSMYFRSIDPGSKMPHLYLKDRQGLYPGYPDQATKHIILTEAIIDAATLQVHASLTKDTTVLALYGTNGLTAEHKEAISQLKKLETITLFMDGDAAGRKAAEKYSQVLKELKPGVTVNIADTPEGEDINSLLDGHSPKVLDELINGQKITQQSAQTQQSVVKDQQQKVSNTHFDTSNPDNIRFTGKSSKLIYYVKGFKRRESGSLDSLKAALQISKGKAGHSFRGKCDLYEFKQVQSLSRQASERLKVTTERIENDLNQLTDLLEAYRNQTTQQGEQASQQVVKIAAADQTKCLELLKDKAFFTLLNELIGKAGVIGEHNNRLLLFIIASTYPMAETLHALVQGSSGSGKTHLVTKIASLMPPEHTIALTRVTESSFYNYGEHELCNRLLVLEDLDGLKEDAFLAFRELQSRGLLNSSTSEKDEQGHIRAVVKTVRGPIASMAATTKGTIYEDNMSRCLVVAVDESAEQTQRVIAYQNRRAAGSIDKAQESKAVQLLQNCMRLIKPCEVVNPYAARVQLPQQAHKIRRLNQLYQSFVTQITLLHQYQRKRDKQGRLISEKDDLRLACEILFEAIVLKVDELDGPLRNYFEGVKEYVSGKEDRSYQFTRREIREVVRVSKAQQHFYTQQLIEYEYIQQVNGHANRGFKYQITYWDSLTAIRGKIKSSLEEQLNKL